MIRDYNTFLQSKGIQVTEDHYREFMIDKYGQPEGEWTRDQKARMKKGINKILDKYAERFKDKPHPEDVIDHLWYMGWEYREFGGVVTGLNEWVDNWVEANYPKEDMDLSREELEDPYLKEVLQILKDFYVKPDARECRMILRRKSVPWTVRYACELFRAHSKPQRHYTVKNILDEADFRWSVRNDRNHDPI